MKSFSGALCVSLVAVLSASSAAAQDQNAAAVVAAQTPAAAPITAPAPATGQLVGVNGGRSLHVMVAQSELKSDINPSNAAVYTGGGLLGGLIGAAMDSARAKKAEALITPVRTAVADVDADSLAIAAAKAGFAKADWNRTATETSFSKDSSPTGKSAYLDSNPNAETAFVEYSYDLSPNFDAVRVIERIEVASKSAPASKPEKRLQPKYLVYSGSVASIITLPDAGKDKEANAARWAADNGKLTRAALTQAFNRLQDLTPRLLSMSAADKAALDGDKKNKRIMLEGYYGRPQAVSDGSTLLWTGAGFAQITPIR